VGSGEPPARPQRRPLSKDALLVEHLTRELRRRGIARDAFLVVRPHLPADWTRERWDRAAAELEQGHAGIVPSPQKTAGRNHG
jgi:hypothetical protein